MPEKTLSIFIDESGDFGPYEKHSPYYLIVMVLHNQDIDLTKSIRGFDRHIQNLKFISHAVHTAPLIRRESIYKNDLRENRTRLFNALFNFVRGLDIKYTCIKVEKSETPNSVSLTEKIKNEMTDILQTNQSVWKRFNQIIVYYDNGQVELTRILTSTFTSFFTQIEFRTVKPIDYKLLQVADLICTVELLSIKAENKSFSRSELDFFGNIRNFKKNYLKPIRKKLL